MSHIFSMRDIRGYRAYQRLKGGWRLLSLALLGTAVSAFLSCLSSLAEPGHWAMLGSLALGMIGSLSGASGAVGGRFRVICLALACNYGLLLAWDGSGGLAWFTLLVVLYAGDRCLRQETGLSRGASLFPPGCMLCLLALPFFWPVAILMGGSFLAFYLVLAYAYVASALPRPKDLAAQLAEPPDEAMAALTRT